eukprot:TRINITY_DN10821_c0_g1_i1.p1 TRINITY_DN10821_c0_g1~~TRINITY_DN10821_c0_g1_i1.p1  ORF type:complete len:307 (+),score=72.09 TRINITY_DN10821_c0_g1_i1:41-961(+)
MLVPCKACGSTCSAVCEGFSRCLCPDNKPSPLFVIFSTIMNALLLLFAVLGLTAKKEDPGPDYDPPMMWLGVAIGIAVVNIIFAVYLYWRFAHMTKPSEEQKNVSAMKAAAQLFLYDIGVCLYLGFGVFMIVWCIIDKKCDDKGTDLCEDQNDAITKCKIILGLYMGLGVVVIFLSVCTECCRPPRYITTVGVQPGYQPYNPNNPAAPPSYQTYQQPAQANPPPQAYPAAPVAPQQPYQQPQQQPYQQQQQPAYAPPDNNYQQQQYQQQPYQQQQQQPPPQNPTMAEKAGNAVGGLLGKGLNAVRK